VDAVTVNPQREIVLDMARRGLIVSPALLLAGAVGWGVNGALSVALALAIVLINFAASAAVVRKVDDLPQSFIMMFVLGGFAVRMLFVLGAITVAGHLSWVSKVPLGLAIVFTHLGLLVWETRHISASLAYPGLKPKRGVA
jgi:ABC-type microcin C transport system permease subunit YejB